MGSEILSQEIKKYLVKYERSQQVFFTWLCAVRVLPFLLLEEGHFRCSVTNNSKNRPQEHLFAVLWALDSIINASIQIDYNVEVIYDAAHDVESVSSTLATEYASDAAKAIVNAARFAATPTYAKAITNAIKAATYAVKAATFAARDTRVFVDLKQIILQDLKSIAADHLDGFNNDITIYGPIWNLFQRVFADIGCAYWGQLYTNLFNKGFVMDENDRIALKRRLLVPKEIREQGADVVAHYLVDLEKQGGKRLNESRIILLGEKGAGKTSLARRLIDPDASMPQRDESTEGVDTYLWEIPAASGDSDTAVNAHIWDFAGHVITHAVHRCFLSERCLYILIYNGRIERDNRPTYWLDQIKTYGGDAPIIVLINQQDYHYPDIPENTLKEKYPSIIGFYTVDIGRDTEALRLFRQTVVGFLRLNPNWRKQEVPVHAYQIKEALNICFHKNKSEYITLKAFEQIAQKEGVTADEMERLLDALHTLGICLRYKEKMSAFGILVLNPAWISNGIYKLINWGFRNKKYVLSPTDGKTVFENQLDRYPEDKLIFLFELMVSYELAFLKDDGELFVPLLLPEDQPKHLPDFPLVDRLHLQYKTDQPLPPNIVTRLIVRHHTELQEETGVWRYGAVFHDGSTTALVREEEREINLYVKGTDKTAYITRLRIALNDIFTSYKIDSPELRVEIAIKESMDNPYQSEPAWIGNERRMLAEEIVRAYAIARRPYLDAATLRDISLTPIAQAYGIDDNLTIAFQVTLDSLDSKDDHSIHNAFNFKDCCIDLQGNLNSLARNLRAAGKENDEDANKLILAATELDEAQSFIANNPDDETCKIWIKKKGVLSCLKDICDEWNNRDSDFYKNTKSIRRGVQIAQEIANQYNEIAQWFGLPQVPQPFVVKHGED